MAEEQQQEQKVKISLKIPKINVWAVSTVILAFAIVAVWFFKPTGPTGFAVQVLPAEEAGKKAIDYINQNLVQAGTNASLISVKDMGTFYEVMTSYRGNQIPVYVSKDGKYLWVSVPINMEEPIEIPKTKEQPTKTIGNFLVSKDEICKENNKPIIYFFGSNRCPHCRWEHPILNNVTSKFEGYISYHDNIDTEKDSEVFSKYSTGGIPTIVLGCRYYRVGSGESIGEEQEAKVLTALICKLTENKPTAVCSEVQDLINQI